jgi:hypothetical protein
MATSFATMANPAAPVPGAAPPSAHWHGTASSEAPVTIASVPPPSAVRTAAVATLSSFHVPPWNIVHGSPRREGLEPAPAPASPPTAPASPTSAPACPAPASIGTRVPSTIAGTAKRAATFPTKRAPAITPIGAAASAAIGAAAASAKGAAATTAVRASAASAMRADFASPPGIGSVANAGVHAPRRDADGRSVPPRWQGSAAGATVAASPAASAPTHATAPGLATPAVFAPSPAAQRAAAPSARERAAAGLASGAAVAASPASSHGS